MADTPVIHYHVEVGLEPGSQSLVDTAGHVRMLLAGQFRNMLGEFTHVQVTFDVEEPGSRPEPEPKPTREELRAAALRDLPWHR